MLSKFGAAHGGADVQYANARRKSRSVTLLIHSSV